MGTPKKIELKPKNNIVAFGCHYCGQDYYIEVGETWVCPGCGARPNVLDAIENNESDPSFDPYINTKRQFETWKGTLITDENREQIENEMIEFYGYDINKTCTMCDDRPLFLGRHLASMCAKHMQDYIDKGWR